MPVCWENIVGVLRKKNYRKKTIFQNRIMIEQDVISKLIHRCNAKMKKINQVDYTEELTGAFQNQQATLRDDMKTYIKLHYELKEEMMDYFLKWL